jgi:hypothetical protein
MLGFGLPGGCHNSEELRDNQFIRSDCWETALYTTRMRVAKAKRMNYEGLVRQATIDPLSLEDQEDRHVHRLIIAGGVLYG